MSGTHTTTHNAMSDLGQFRIIVVPERVIIFGFIILPFLYFSLHTALHEKVSSCCFLVVTFCTAQFNESNIDGMTIETFKCIMFSIISI